MNRPPHVCEVKHTGFQPGLTPGSGFNLYTLCHDISGHDKGSTVSAKTLKRHGFTQVIVHNEESMRTEVL